MSDWLIIQTQSWDWRLAKTTVVNCEQNVIVSLLWGKRLRFNFFVEIIRRKHWSNVHLINICNGLLFMDWVSFKSVLGNDIIFGYIFPLNCSQLLNYKWHSSFFHIWTKKGCWGNYIKLHNMVIFLHNPMQNIRKYNNLHLQRMIYSIVCSHSLKDSEIAFVAIKLWISTCQSYIIIKAVTLTVNT